jgi:hypothetical protein
MMLHVAHESMGDRDITSMRSVFASRYGSLSTMLSMLAELAVDKPLSPSRFSHSVHNTQAGLFSIWAKNSQASTSIAACRQTFAHGFLESISVLHFQPSEAGPVLLVVGDESVPASAAGGADSDEGAYAFALILDLAKGDEGVEFSIAPGSDSQHSDVPEALHFLRWLISDSPSLRLAYPERTWVWNRV